MSDGGLSSAGGLGGVGEPKLPKEGISGAGEANQSDIEKFTTAISPDQAGKGEDVKITINLDQKGPSGPLDFQTNRVRDSDIVGKPEGMGKLVVKETQNMISLGRTMEQSLMVKAAEAKEKGYDSGSMLELQFEMGQYTTLVDVVSKGVNKFVQAIQSAAKNQ